MKRRLRDALRAGLTAHVVTTFAVAFLLSPLLAAHVDFGHVHPENTPAHVHAVVSLFGLNTAPSDLELNFGWGSSLAVLVLITTLFIDRPRISSVNSRAPPVGVESLVLSF